MKYTATDIAKLGTILGVYAHPDDECWTSGGILAAACENGQQVACITVTHGDAGQTTDETKWPQARLSEIREHELSDSLACLGKIEHHWLSYGDGALRDVPESEPVEQIAELIEQIKPDTILTFGPDGLTGHSDHKMVGKWAELALRRTGRAVTILQVRETTEKYAACGKILHDIENIYFAALGRPVTIPAAQADVFFELPEELHRKKMASIAAHHSQKDATLANPRGRAATVAYAKTEAFVKAYAQE
ncbi:MAG TPA: PIG-L deacetylase family protein [Candidatus Saccharimonadales bacterium]|nr:PIG-L deacetylase family protein [Candidatus Saccharimonadales bacterium]